MEILVGILHRFTHRSVGGAVDDRLDFVFIERIPNQVPLCNVTFDQRSPLYGPTMTRAEIVDDNMRVTCACQCLAGVATDITRAARYQDTLHVTSLARTT